MLETKIISEIILNTSLFGSLSESLRFEIAQKMKCIDFEPKENIVITGELGDSLYLINQGLVEVIGNDYITGDEFVLAHLGPGDCFGEMSLLTGEKRSATVRAFEKTSVLQLDSQSFDELMLNSSSLGLAISKILAIRLAKLNQRIEELKGQQTVINKMLNTELDLTSEISILGRSNAMRSILQKVEESANSCGFWAIRGGPGTGKKSIARVIHRYGIRINQPLLALDCANASADQQYHKLIGTKTEPGFLNLAHSGTIILINASKLDKTLLSDLLKEHQLKLNKKESLHKPLILALYKENEQLIDELLDKERIIDIPPLNSRKQDIPIIAKKLLERLSKSDNTRNFRLSSDALGRLLEYNWPGNLKELESILEQSTLMAKDSIINEEQIIFDISSAMQDPYMESVKSLAIALDAKDPYTAGHSERVAIYSQEIAKLMGLDDSFISNLYRLALFHDVGKIGISESILRKKTHLSEEEYFQIQKHPEGSLRILQPLNKYLSDLESVLHHHTHYDGTGYPGGISAECIPLGARIISVADTFDAMTTDRPYRKSLPMQMAIEELQRVSGKQLDPKVIKIMLRIIEEGRVIKT